MSAFARVSVLAQVIDRVTLLPVWGTHAQARSRGNHNVWSQVGGGWKSWPDDTQESLPICYYPEHVARSSEGSSSFIIRMQGLFECACTNVLAADFTPGKQLHPDWSQPVR